MIGRRRPKDRTGKLLADTEELVRRLVEENRLLRARNARLEKEIARLNEGWEQIKQLVRGGRRTPQRR